MTWLVILAWSSLSLGFLCALIIVTDIVAGNPQHMWIMDIVWPVTALWSGPMGLYAYYKVGKLAAKRKVMAAKERGEEPPNKKKPFWQMTGEAATHCGAGCTLGDIAAEWIMFFTPWVLFGKELYGTWVIDYVWAYTLGIIFQYFTIAPMRGLSIGKGILAAIKADTLSLTAWQIGMYGWIAIVAFVIFGYQHRPHADSPVFWFMMQIGMMCGFLTSYPINWFLLKVGWKEKM